MLEMTGDLLAITLPLGLAGGATYRNDLHGHIMKKVMY